MNKKEIVLDSGVKLVMINTDKFKTVNVTLFFEDKLSDFNVTCDNLLASLLITKTSKHSSRKEFKSYLKDLYDMKIKVFKSNPGEVYNFNLNIDALNKKYTINNENLLEKQFEVLNELLYSPLISNDIFDEAYFKEIKNEYRQNLINNENYKEYIVSKKVNKILGDNNKLFVLSSGYIEELDKIENKDVYNKYLSLNSLCREIVVCGEIDFDEVVSYVNKYIRFDSVRNTGNYLYKNEFKKYDDYSYDSKFGQSSIAILYDLDVYVGEKLYYPAIIFTEMFNYYLFKIVREEHNFCYSIYTSYLSSRGLCYLQSNIESKNYEKTLELVGNIINDLKNNIDEKVLNICKDKIISSFRKEVDSPLKMIIKEHERKMYNLEDIATVVEICKNVTSEQIKEIANKIEKKFSIILKEGN